jgi:DNA invertase Pin-like site-specific DNA recombinase
MVCGVAHWKRRTIRDWDANRPGARAGGGRPKGSKDTKPRTPATDKRLALAQARKDRVAQTLATGKGKVTAAEIAADLGITERQAYRVLNEVRAAAK